MQSRLLVSLASVLVAIPLVAAPAFAAGGGGGGGGGSSAPTCSKGKVRDRNGKCVTPRRGELDDDSVYENGRALAMEGRYGEAIAVLSLATDKTDPRILNYLGYAHRKQGRITVGLGYYQEALNNDPDYTLVREYMGEAYLQLGDIASARNQLTEIGKRCGKGCKEYQELATQIEAFAKGG
jgi:tetratricopeptide (TPR) repeat protein